MEECKACGYKYDYDWKEGKQVVTHGDEKFINIRIQGHTFSDGEDSYSILACPKCHTLKLEWY